MRGKKRKISEVQVKEITEIPSKTNDVPVKKRRRKKAEIKFEVEKPESEILSLPTLSDEKVYCNDHMKTRAANRVHKKLSIPPRVEIKCVPLNIKKIIDFENKEVVVNEIKKVGSKPQRKPGQNVQKRKRRTNVDMKLIEDSKGSSKATAGPRGTVIKVKCILKKPDAADTVDKSPKPVASKIKATNDSQCKINPVSKGSVHLNPNQVSVPNNSPQKTSEKNESFKINRQEHNGNDLNTNLNYDILNDLELSGYLANCEMNYTPLLINENNSGGLNFENSFLNTVQMTLDDTNSLSFYDSALSGCKGPRKVEKITNKVFNERKTSLQAAVENFLENPKLQCSKETSALKTGLCMTWLTNNYVCSNKQCLYSHCALKLFTKKMKTYSSKFVLSIVTSMRDDVLFVDVIMAAFKVLSARKVPVVWVTFLTYFVFYVTEPSDSRFLKFWANAARFFCQLSNQYTAANGFASLLSVFSMGLQSEEWKITEFIKLIKQPPIQISVSYELLEPVIGMDLPTQFLTEAIEFCMAAQKDVLQVYDSIVPKISVMTSPIQIIELLLKFCKTLEVMDLKAQVDDLKWRLREKVKSFKTKITSLSYPLTTAFQEDILLNRDSFSIDFQSGIMSRESLKEMTPPSVNLKRNYFQPDDEFFLLMDQTLELARTTGPVAIKTQPPNNGQNNEKQEEDACERQITRIRQFFRDRQFDLLGKYLNDLKSNVIEQASNEFLKLLFQMKISLQQVMDVIRIILLPCKSDNAAEVVANVCLSLLLNLVRINEWEKAYKIFVICQGKHVNLIKGKIFHFKHSNTLTECRVALLLTEINAYNEDFAGALTVIKNHMFFSSNPSVWKLTWNTQDETIRVKILEDLLQVVISKELTEIAYELFTSILQEQRELNRPVGLKKFINEVLILLLNEGNEQALNLYKKMENEIQLNDITVRAILVTLVRQNHLQVARHMLVSTTQTIYFLPDVISGPCTLTISRYWLEEEIFIIFNAFLEQVVTRKCSAISEESDILDINIQISKPVQALQSKIRPLCLGIINPSYKDTCSRIERVLSQFSPPLKLTIRPYYIKVDEYSLQVYLSSRISQSLGKPQNFS